MQRPANFLPQTDYLVTQATEYSNVDQRTLTYLYQPILGTVATALYSTLWTDSRRHPMFTKDRQPHTRLLATLGTNMDELYNARIRLEAMRLIQTYTQVDQTRHYVYEMYAPVQPSAFFADDLLGILLFDTVGEERYQQLVDIFTLTPVRRQDMHNVSKQFLDVFSILASNPATPPAAVQAAKEATAVTPTSQPELADVRVDWELLERLLANTNIQTGVVKQNQHALQQLAGFYGLDEPTLATQIGKAADLLTGKLDMGRLRTAIEQQFTRDGVRHYRSRGVQSQTVADTAIRLNGSKPSDERESTMLTRAKSMSVREFLSATKQAKNSKMYASRNEIKAVLELVERGTFPNATVNVMVDYLLQDHDNISAAFLNSVANTWIAAGVQTPEQALTQIHNYKSGQTPAQEQQRQRRKSSRGQQRHEPVPDWMQQQNGSPASTADTQTQTTPVAKAELQAQMQKLAQRRQQSKE